MRRLDIVPAHFPGFHRAHARAQGVRQQLGAQADAEHGDFSLQGPLDTAHFHLQVRVAVALVGHLRPAEHDQRVVLFDIRVDVRVAVEIHVADAVSAGAQHGVERAQWLRRDVLKDQYFSHRYHIVGAT